MIIKFEGRTWQLMSRTEKRLVFMPAVDLAAWRKNKKLTQRDAAAKLGISQTQLAKIELGTRKISESVLAKLI